MSVPVTAQRAGTRMSPESLVAARRNYECAPKVLTNPMFLVDGRTTPATSPP